MVRYSLFILLILLVPTLWNMASVVNNSTSLRGGLGKFAVSYFAVIYYCYTFFCISILSGFMGIEKFLAFSSKSFLYTSIFMIFIAAVEITSWYVAEVRSLFIGFRSIFAEFPERTLFRISGVSLEPSFFSFAILTAIPWTIFYYKRYRSRLAMIVTILLVLICMVSGARTAYVGLAGLFSMWMLSRLRSSALPYLAAAVPASAMILGLIFPLAAYSMLSSFDSVSNITRTFLASRAVVIGIEHPFGVGFGQVPFFLAEKMNSYIKLSWELEAWHSGSRAGELMPIFSWYGRTIGEIGLFLYIFLSFILCRMVFVISMNSLKFQNGSMGLAIFQMLFAYWGVFLASGISSDSYRVLLIWFTMLISAIYAGFWKKFLVS